MSKVETIKIEHKDGYAIINKSDFDEKKHKEYKEKEDKPKAVKKEGK